MKNWLGVIVLLAIAAVLVNDGGRYVQTRYELSNITRDAAAASAEAAKRAPDDRTASWQAGEELAEKYGAEIYGYDIRNGSVHVWTRMPVPKTWVLRRAMALVDSKPATAPFTVEDELEAMIQ